MRVKQSHSSLTSKEAKMVAAIYETAKEGLDPSMNAVAYILRGEGVVERLSFFQSFGSLTSLSVKKIKASLTGLSKKGFLASYSPYPYQEKYLLLTEEGEKEAEAALSKKIRKAVKKPAIPLFNERK